MLVYRSITFLRRYKFIASWLFSSYILFYLLCQDVLAKLASIFVIVFQFEPANGKRHHTAIGILFIPYDFTAKLTARGLILSSSWRVTSLWNFDIYQ